MWNLLQVGNTDFQGTNVRGLCAILKTFQGPLAVIEKEACLKKAWSIKLSHWDASKVNMISSKGVVPKGVIANLIFFFWKKRVVACLGEMWAWNCPAVTYYCLMNGLLLSRLRRFRMWRLALGSKHPLVTRVARTGLGTRLLDEDARCWVTQQKIWMQHPDILNPL